MVRATSRQLAGLSELAHLVASGAAVRRADLAAETGLSRAAVAQRVDLLIAHGLLVESNPASTPAAARPGRCGSRPKPGWSARSTSARGTAGWRSPVSAATSSRRQRSVSTSASGRDGC